MNENYKKIIWLGTREVLLTLFDLSLPFFYAEKCHRKKIFNYQLWRESDKIKTKRSVSYLIKKGHIESFVKNKTKYIELTPKGVEYLAKQSIKELKLKKHRKWDKKWRLIVFDIPEKLRFERDIWCLCLSL